MTLVASRGIADETAGTKWHSTRQPVHTNRSRDTAARRKRKVGGDLRGSGWRPHNFGCLTVDVRKNDIMEMASLEMTLLGTSISQHFHRRICPLLCRRRPRSIARLLACLIACLLACLRGHVRPRARESRLAPIRRLRDACGAGGRGRLLQPL